MIDYGYGVTLSSSIPKIQTFEWRNSQTISKWCRQVSLLTEEGHAQWHRDNQFDQSNRMYSVIRSGKEEKGPVGIVGLTHIDLIARHAEIAIYIDPFHIGEQWGTKALQTITRHGFEEFNFRKLWAEIFDSNHASLELFKRIGYKSSPGHIAHYYKEGQYINTVYMTLFKQDFYLT